MPHSRYYVNSYPIARLHGLARPSTRVSRQLVHHPVSTCLLTRQSTFPHFHPPIHISILLPTSLPRPRDCPSVSVHVVSCFHTQSLSAELYTVCSFNRFPSYPSLSIPSAHFPNPLSSMSIHALLHLPFRLSVRTQIRCSSERPDVDRPTHPPARHPDRTQIRLFIRTSGCRPTDSPTRPTSRPLSSQPAFDPSFANPPPASPPTCTDLIACLHANPYVRGDTVNLVNSKLANGKVYRWRVYLYPSEEQSTSLPNNRPAYKTHPSANTSARSKTYPPTDRPSALSQTRIPI